MKADLTRSTFRPERHYSGVRMQQGRVQLDADWNEQVDIDAHLDETTRIDVIGRCGMPEDDAGFGVTPSADNTDLVLSPGRAYVDGILCENDTSPVDVVGNVAASKVKLAALVADGLPLENGDWISIAATGVGPFFAHVTALDPSSATVTFAPALAATDVSALNNAKDAAVSRVATFLTQPDFPGTPPTQLELDVGTTYLAYLDVWERHITALEDGAIREVALGGPDTATRTQTVWQVRLQPFSDSDHTMTCATVPDFATFVQPSTALMSARAQPETTSDDLCTIPPGAGFRRLENQLYRVEIHDSGNVGAATFKWSRENGSVVVTAQITGNDEITVSSLGRDEALGIAPGSWVELTDDIHDLGGTPGTLLKVKSIAGNVLTVDTSASGNLNANQFPANPKVRRWDDPDGPRKVTVPGTNDGFLALEDGVEVGFEPGRRYVSGDYWLIPARTATGDVEWPNDRETPANPLARPPEGIDHHYCKLALLFFDGKTWQVKEDCRNLFPPLTGIHAVQQDPGVHVVNVHGPVTNPLRNDTNLLVTELARGITIECDQDLEPNTLVNKPTLFMTLDLPWPLSTADIALWGDQVVGTMPLTLDGIVHVNGNTILWTPSPTGIKWLLGQFRKVLISRKVTRVLLHLTLKGNYVYAVEDPKTNVDGETFGVLHDGTLDAALPSGDGRRGGNLDLWYWLLPRTATTDQVMLVPLTQSTGLTSIAKRNAFGRMISLGVDRSALLETLGDSFTVNTGATVDPAQAQNAITRARIISTRPLRLAVEDTLAGAADAILAQLKAKGITVPIQATPIADLVDTVGSLAGQGFDAILASKDTVDAIVEVEGALLDTAHAVTL